MNIKITKEFIAGEETYSVGQAVDIDDEIAGRVIDARWAVPVDEEFPHHVGGGYYLLSNGEKVKGKEEAIESQALL